VNRVRVFACTRYDNFRIFDREGSFWYANTSSESVDRASAAQGQGHGINSQKTPAIKSKLVCFKGVRTTAESSCVFVNVVFVKWRNDFLIIIANRLDIIRRSWRRLRRRLNGISIDSAYEGCRNALLNRLMVDVFCNFVSDKCNGPVDDV